MLHLFRVAYVYRPFKGSSPQEKVSFVVADTDQAACSFINSTEGNEVMGVSNQAKNVLVAPTGGGIETAPRPAPKSERLDDRLGEK